MKKFVKGLIIAGVSLVYVMISSPQAAARFLAVTGSKFDMFQSQILNSIEHAVDLQGDDVFIDVADGSFKRQFDQLSAYLAAGADAVMVLRTDSTDEQMLSLIHKAGNLPLVFIGKPPLDEASKIDTLPANVIYVGSNELESGTLQMEELARLAGYRGKVALLSGDPSHNAAKIRTQDVKNVLSKYPDLKLIKSDTANWNRNEAYTITKQWIDEKLDFDVLVANNDEMIIGAILAMQDAGVDPKKYLTGGIDATSDALAMMDAGNLSVTILQDASKQAQEAVNACYRLMQNESVPRYVWVPFRLVTPDNLDQFLKK